MRAGADGRFSASAIWTLFRQDLARVCSPAAAILQAGSRGQISPEGGLFSCPIRQRQLHVFNRDGARRHRNIVQSKTFVTRPRDSSGRLTSPFRTGFNYSAGYPLAIKGRTLGQNYIDRLYPLNVKGDMNM